MPNPTREDIIEAHKALTNLLKLASSTSTASAIFNEQIVRDALPPKPQPTMAEVEWDDDEHYLAEAEHPDFGKVIMLGEGRTPGFIRTIRGKENDAFWGTAGPYNLTPTGKRYTLTEIQE
ncbi:hypothetical protein RAE03_10510 [Corynebacterium tuberculostearicum]|uniref:Uncharacterized protein n=1 Tax=Corynebacterium tuberculostearicum TaxID=38304 RepID=A0AAE4NNW6_9CORY|nr:hypothetical protein [Corynebacterium tuberculostearicum]MDV2420194.1 hypothetical protein [Corynebacterium tuberculostearicum]